MRFLGLLVPLFALAMTSVYPAQKQSADVIFVNGDIYTRTFDPIVTGTPPWAGGSPPTIAAPRHAQGIAISCGRIISTGDNQVVLRFKTKKTEVIDRGGHLRCPASTTPTPTLAAPASTPN